MDHSLAEILKLELYTGKEAQCSMVPCFPLESLSTKEQLRTVFLSGIPPGGEGERSALMCPYCPYVGGTKYLINNLSGGSNGNSDGEDEVK